MFNSILIVCTGNICRSPIGERFLKKMLSTKRIDSAGTHALINHPADETAVKISQKNGLSLTEHVGKQFTPEMARDYDLILVMEKKHIETIGKLAPEARGKTMLYGHWLDGREIPDPYRKSEEAFDSVYLLIAQAGRLWVEKLNNY
ncbi:TPA: protein tyrosine phosphatase [Klebsiella quasipneumoniae subsp. quasipneumoniae]|nr:protein tyrosine phosphatase [Klebsiella quasipneumoniae subsp. quasipneumoniae]